MKLQTLLCWLGFHDWETIRWKSSCDIAEEAYGKSSVTYLGGTDYQDRVCVHCHVIDKQIDAEIAKRKAKLDLCNKRKQLAKDIFNKSTN
jgi:hypothetical protein